MQEKGMPKVCKMMPKGNQNESQNPSKIAKILKKRHAEIYTKKWCRKRAHKCVYGPRNEQQRYQRWGPGGKEDKPPRLASWLLLSETPDTGRCRRIVVRGDCRILAVEAIFFCAWNWLTLAGTGVTGAVYFLGMVPEIEPKSTKTSNISSKRFPKPMKNRGWVAHTFWSVLGRPLGTKRVTA